MSSAARSRTAAVLRVIAKAWGSLVTSLVLIGSIAIIVTRGWTEFTDTFSPFNLWNWGLILLLLSPALALFALADRLSR